MAEDSRLTSEEVYVELRTRILEHTLPPATKIRIRSVAQELGVSTTPVREALRQLQGDGLLVGTSHRGYATTDVLDAHGVTELFEFRLLLEPWAASSAAQNRLVNPARDLLDEIDRFDPESGPLNLVMIRHDSAFHRAILGATQNSVVIDAYARSHCHLHLFRAFRDDWDWRSSLDQHRVIAEAIARARPEEAAEAMREHLQMAYQGFISGLTGHNGPDNSIPAHPEMIARPSMGH